MQFASIVQLYALIIVHLQLGMNDAKVNIITAQRTKINQKTGHSHTSQGKILLKMYQ